MLEAICAGVIYSIIIYTQKRMRNMRNRRQKLSLNHQPNTGQVWKGLGFLVFVIINVGLFAGVGSAITASEVTILANSYSVYIDSTNKKIYLNVKTWIDGSLTSKLYYTTDVGNTTPSWTLLGTLTEGIFLYPFHVSSDEKLLYARHKNTITGVSNFSVTNISTLITTSISLSDVPEVMLYALEKMHTIAEDKDGIVYFANYPLPMADQVIGTTGVILNGTNSSFTVFHNFSSLAHVHSVHYSNITDRLYFTHDDGAGYINLTSLVKTMLIEPDKMSSANEVTTVEGQEIFVASDFADAYIYRYNQDGVSLNNYSIFNTSPNVSLFETSHLYGDKLFIGSSPTGAQLFNTGFLFLNIFNGTWDWIVNGTDDTGILYSGQIDDYLYFFGDVGDGKKLWFINLTAVTEYDLFTDDVKLIYMSGGVVKSFTTNPLSVDINGTRDCKMIVNNTAKPFKGTNLTWINQIYDSNVTLTAKLNGTETIKQINVSITPSSLYINVTVTEYSSSKINFTAVNSTANQKMNITVSNGTFPITNGKQYILKKDGVEIAVATATDNEVSFVDIPVGSEYTIEEDTTAPTLYLSLSNTSIYTGQSLIIYCSATDNAEISSTNLTVTKPNDEQVSALCNETFNDTSLIGTYTVTYTATDISGNSASTNKTFTVCPKSGIAKIQVTVEKRNATITISSISANVLANITISKEFDTGVVEIKVNIIIEWSDCID